MACDEAVPQKEGFGILFSDNSGSKDFTERSARMRFTVKELQQEDPSAGLEWVGEPRSPGEPVLALPRQQRRSEGSLACISAVTLRGTGNESDERW